MSGAGGGPELEGQAVATPPAPRFATAWAPMGWAVIDTTAEPLELERVRVRGLESLEDAERIRDCMNGTRPTACTGCSEWAPEWGALACCRGIPAPRATK